jgi:hypothetical protein
MFKEDKFVKCVCVYIHLHITYIHTYILTYIHKYIHCHGHGVNIIATTRKVKDQVQPSHTDNYDGAGNKTSIYDPKSDLVKVTPLI